MKVDPAVKAHVATAFARLNNEAAVHAFPEPASLSRALERANPSGAAGALAQAKTAQITRLFTTASVDMWMRAVHSFLISASLTSVSPIWASSAGYYSSHYSVRSLAHLLGLFQLFKRKRLVRLELQNGQFVCSYEAKTEHDREHKVYWRFVKLNPLFAADPFFNSNVGDDESDVGHRDWSNYADHLSTFPMFRPLDAAALKSRVERISVIEFDAPPIPQISHYPDIESVQIVAYHRLVRFRDLVDAIVGTSNRFWRVHRNPVWAREFMDFQLTERPHLRSEFSA